MAASVFQKPEDFEKFAAEAKGKLPYLDKDNFKLYSDLLDSGEDKGKFGENGTFERRDGVLVITYPKPEKKRRHCSGWRMATLA